MKFSRYSPLIVAAMISACASTQQDPQSTSTDNQQASSSQPGAQASAAPRGSVDSRGKPRPAQRALNTAYKGAPSHNTVYFDYDQHEIKADYRPVIEDNAKYLREHPSIKVRVEGHGDERGSREYNLALGQRRAEVVTKALNLLGIPASRIEAVSFGEEKPRRTGHDEVSWAENRRGDVVFDAAK